MYYYLEHNKPLKRKYYCSSNSSGYTASSLLLRHQPQSNLNHKLRSIVKWVKSCLKGTLDIFDSSKMVFFLHSIQTYVVILLKKSVFFVIIAFLQNLLEKISFTINSINVTERSKSWSGDVRLHGGFEMRYLLALSYLYVLKHKTVIIELAGW